MEQFRLIGLTAALSFLIWIVADYSLSDTVTLQLRLEPYPAAGGVRVYVDEDASRSCEAVVTGKRTIISMLKTREPLPVRLPVVARSPGEHELNIKESLRNAEGELAEIIVQDVNPPTLSLRVDQDKVVTMPVFVRPGTLDYDGPVVIDPNEVQVTMSQLDYEKLAPDDRRVVLDPDEYLRTAPHPGELQSRPVPLKSVVGPYSVQLDPDFVTVKFKLAEQLQELTISAVPIKIEASLEIFNRYRVEVREAGAILTQPITVKGRAEVLERIRSDAVRIWGVIAVTAADKAELDQYRYQLPQFNLPDGVELASEPEPIEFRLVPISKDTPAP